ncbi:MAG: hypothetical protein KDB27_16645, partial [Planctomycetales bacterium]|nr:hypothetical protein [Planctomycetales bacterium]
MFTAISQQVVTVQRSIQRLVVGRAMALWLTITLIAGATIGSIDYGLSIQDLGLRWLLTGIFLSVSGVTAFATIRPALRYQPNLIQVARWVESIFPELTSQLSSCIDFLERERQGDSNPFQKRVLLETENRLQDVDISKSVDSRPFFSALAVAVAAVSLLLSVAIWMPRVTTTSMLRIALPWAQTRWPGKNHLEFVGVPSTVARGNDVLIMVQDRNGQIPDDAKLEFRFAGAGNDSVLTQPPVSTRGDSADFKLLNLQRDLQIRAVGGDDDSMRWHSLEVVDAPTVKKLRMLATEPRYTNAHPREVQSGEVVLEGTTLQIDGTATRPISKAWLHVTSRGIGNESFQLDVRDRRFQLSAESFVELNHSVRLSIELFGIDGVSSGHVEHRELVVVADQPPIARLLSPDDRYRIGPRGEVTIVAEVTEDVGVSSALLQVIESDGNDLVTVPLSSVLAEGDRKRISFDVDAASLCSLSTDREFSYYVTVTDLKGQIVATETRTIVVATNNELLTVVTDLLAATRQQIDVAINAQKTNRSRLLELQSENATNENAVLDEVESIHSIVRSRLFGETTSVTARLQDIENIVTQNQLQLDDLHAAIPRWLHTLSDMQDGPLSKIETLLREFRFTGQQRAVERADRQFALSLQTLKQIYDELSAHAGNQEFMESLREIRKKQIDIYDATLSLSGRKSASETAKQELGRSQQSIANQLEEVIVRRDAQATEGLVRLIVDQLTNTNVVVLMDQASNELLKGSGLNASRLQRRVLDSLDIALKLASPETSDD